MINSTIKNLKVCLPKDNIKVFKGKPRIGRQYLQNLYIKELLCRPNYSTKEDNHKHTKIFSASPVFRVIQIKNHDEMAVHTYYM